MKDWDAQVYREQTGFVSELGLPVVELLDPCRGERILDVGCGDGVLTGKLAAQGCEVTGIDASPDMVRAARERGVDARLMDAAVMDFDEEFDAVFSNAALHWMRPPEAVVRNIHRALKPKGRFVAEFGGRGNVAHIRHALHESLRSRGIAPENVDPWYFPSPGEYAELLRDNGFKLRSATHFERPTPLPGGLASWLESVARPFCAAVPAAMRGELLADLEDRLAPVLLGEDGSWRADYVRLRIVAVKAPVA